MNRVIQLWLNESPAAAAAVVIVLEKNVISIQVNLDCQLFVFVRHKSVRSK